MLPINSQILQMVVDNLTDISMVGIAPSNPLYNVYQYTVGYKVHLTSKRSAAPKASLSN